MKTLIFACAAAVIALASARAQVEATQSPSNDVPTTFDVDAISFASDSARLSRLDIYAALPYEHLSFVSKDGQFVAAYEMTIDIFDSRNALVSEKLWTREIKVQSFEHSVASGSYSVEQRSMVIPPGHYQIAIICRDVESRQTRRVNKQIEISDYSRPGLQLSDIMLISKFTVRDDGKKNITPSISSNVGSIGTPFYIFFEAYTPTRPDSVKLVTTIFNVKNEEMQKSDTTIVFTSARSQVFLPVDQSALPIGDYKMFVQAFSTKAAPAQSSLANTSRSFIVRWAGLPKSVKDLDLAIEQLSYIAKDKEIEVIKQAKTSEEKQKRFLEFWKKRDPNPNTIRNERMEEHYARVEYANKHFKHYTEGWRTDMGMVYIIFGTPNNVDRHPFDSDSKPYEVWSYYEINYNFVFVDQTGFGDYRLTTPIWDVWQRPRN